MATTAQSILESVRAIGRKRKTEALGGFEKMVISIADGKSVAHEQVFELLRSADKTEEDLEAAVALRLNRNTWIKQIEAELAMLKRDAEARARIAVVEQKKADAIKPFDAELEELALSLSTTPENMAIAVAASSARESLRNTASPDLMERIGLARAELVQLDNSISGLSASISEARGRLDDGIRQGVSSGYVNESGESVGLSEAAKSCAAAIAAGRKSLAEIEARHAALQKQRDAAAAHLESLDKDRYVL